MKQFHRLPQSYVHTAAAAFGIFLSLEMNNDSRPVGTATTCGCLKDIYFPYRRVPDSHPTRPTARRLE